MFGFQIHFSVESDRMELKDPVPSRGVSKSRLLPENL
jgi:hypothetical protein